MRRNRTTRDRFFFRTDASAAVKVELDDEVRQKKRNLVGKLVQGQSKLMQVPKLLRGVLASGRSELDLSRMAGECVKKWTPRQGSYRGNSFF